MVYFSFLRGRGMSSARKASTASGFGGIFAAFGICVVLLIFFIFSATGLPDVSSVISSEAPVGAYRNSN